MKIFKSRIDKLVNKHAQLLLEKQKIIDKKNEKNSSIETKLKKLENKSYLNQTVAMSKLEEIDRQLRKTSRELESEKEYVASISVKSNKEGK